MSASPLSIGDHITLRLDSLAVGGEAVGRHEGMAVFALWGCPGDTAEVEITEVLRSFARGVVRLLVTPSPDRVQAPCPHFGDCGGCQIQHLSSGAQLRHKTAMIRDALTRIGGMPDVEVADTWGMDKRPWFYRNRAEYHGALDEDGQLVLGFSRHHSHDIIALRECNLQHPFSERVRKSVLAHMSRVAQTPAERAALLGVETLVSFASDQGLVTLICGGRPPFVVSLAEALHADLPDLAGVLFAQRRGHAAHRSPAELVSGESHIVESMDVRGLGDVRAQTGVSTPRLLDSSTLRPSYRVSGDSFFQSNPPQAARMIQLVTEWAGVEKGDVVLDLYSGVGTFLLPLARGARQAVGVEESESAVADARANARDWRLRNVTIHERKVERILPKLMEAGFAHSAPRGEAGQRGPSRAPRPRRLVPDVIVIDPPRKGCGQIVAASVAKLKPRRIILVSCHPATLARDLKSLAEHGYPCRRLQPIDMFPQTWHVEAVAMCERG